MDLTQELCSIIHASTYETLGDECIARVKQAIADGIAVALAGCREEPVAIGVEHVRLLGGAPQAHVWGWGHKVSVVQAAYLNAMATHVLDFEPMWSPPTHAISPTVPVAFALSQLHGASGRQIITAVAKGLEIQGRMQFAGGQFVADKLTFHPPGYVGVLGSAVVAAELLGLDVPLMQHALGIAASRAGSLLANVGSMTKCTHCGNAAASGLDAALLAQRGFTANPDVLEAPRGMIAAFYGSEFDTAKLLAWGKPFRVVDPGLAIKMFPSQFGTHFAITAGLDIHRELGAGARLKNVRMVSPMMRYVDRPQPATGLDGKFSLQYAAAAAMLDGAVGIDTFTDERRFRPDMVALLGNIELTQDAAIPGDFHRMHVQIDAECVDGRRSTAVCRGPKGAWGIPLAAEDHRVKLNDCLARALDPTQIGELIGLLDHLEEQDAAGIQRIVTLIAAPARTPLKGG